MKKWLVKKALPRLLVRMGPWFIRLLGWSVRVEVADPGGLLEKQDRAAQLFVFWHNRILLMPYFYAKFQPRRRLAVLMSQSRDGSFISDIAARFGIISIRGSTSKGAVQALLKLHRLIHGGGVDFALTPDGPRGPLYRIQPGILQLARKSGLPIVPIMTDYESKWEMRSWDRFQVPKPGTRCRLRIGMPVLIGERTDDEVIAELQAVMADEKTGPHGR